MALFPPEHVTAIATPYRHLIDGVSRDGLLSQIDELHRDAWEAMSCHRVLCYLANPAAFTTNETVERIRAGCRAILPVGSAFKVWRPFPSNFVRKAKPVVCLIWDLTAEETSLLARYCAWSLPNGTTMFTFAWDETPSSFCSSYIGFRAPPTREGRLEVETIVRNVLREDNTIRRFVDRHPDDFPDYINPSLHYLLSTIEVTSFRVPLPENPNHRITIWNIFVAPPSFAPKLHRLWRDLVATALRTANIGFRIYVLKAFVCAVCRATSHPTSRCPFPATPGWYGPTLGEVTAHLALSKYVGSRHIAFAGEATSPAREIACFEPDGSYVEDDL